MEHWKGYKAKDPDSHIVKHMTLHHTQGEEPEFIMKVVAFYRTALSRQIGEAVRIERRGLVLNSKAEFSRCKIQRLSLDQKTDEEQMDKARDRGEEQLGDCSDRLLRQRDKKDKEKRRGIEKVQRTSSMKNKQTEDQGTRRKKKRKYHLLSENWGLEEKSINSFLYREEILNAIPSTGTDGRITDWLQMRGPVKGVCVKSVQEGRMRGPELLAIRWNCLQALEYVKTPTLAIEWDGWGPKSKGGNQIYQPPMVQNVKSVVIQNVQNVLVKNVETVEEKNVQNVEEKNVQNVTVKNVVSAQGMKTVRVKRKVWTQRKNGLFGWSFKTVKTSDSEPERVPPLEPAIWKSDCSRKLIKTGHQTEKRKFSGRATTLLEGESEHNGLEGGETKTKRLKMQDMKK
jgi:hypothetical protein